MNPPYGPSGPAATPATSIPTFQLTPPSFGASLYPPAGGGGIINYNPSYQGFRLNLGGDFKLGGDAQARFLDGIIDKANLSEGDARSLLGVDKTSRVMNNVQAGIGTALAAVTTGVQLWQQSRAMDLQADFQKNQMEIAKSYLTSQDKAAEIAERVLDGRNDLVRDLANIQAEVEKTRIKYTSKTSIENTKTKESYAYLNTKFYSRGNPRVHG